MSLEMDLFSCTGPQTQRLITGLAARQRGSEAGKQHGAAERRSSAGSSGLCRPLRLQRGWWLEGGGHFERGELQHHVTARRRLLQPVLLTFRAGELHVTKIFLLSFWAC